MKSEILLETERLILRRMTPNDFDALCGILKDPEVMYAYEGAFDDDMVRAWLENQMKRYEEPGMFVKHSRGVVMPHFVYSVRNDTPGR